MAWTTPSTLTTGTHITAAIWNQQVTDNFAFLGTTHNHSGDAGDGSSVMEIPSGAIAIFRSSCPSGWTRVSAWDNRFIRGASSYGGTGGASTHTHAISSLANHTHSVSSHQHGFGETGVNSTTDSPGTGSGISLSQGHIHYGGGASGSSTDTLSANSPTAGSASSLPAYIAVVFYKKS